MKTKRTLGAGIGKKKKRNKKPSASFHRNILKKIKLLDGETNMKKTALAALKAARIQVKKSGGRRNFRIPRIIPIPKTGGILPLIPIFAGLSALGSLAGGASAIAKTVIDAKNAKKKLEEDTRHNKVMEAINDGKGLYLRKNARGGMGLFLKKQKNSH